MNAAFAGRLVEATLIMMALALAMFLAVKSALPF
jgi:hypothetical protein